MVVVLINKTAVSLVLNYLHITLRATFSLDGSVMKGEKIMAAVVTTPSGERHSARCKIWLNYVYVPLGLPSLLCRVSLLCCCVRKHVPWVPMTEGSSGVIECWLRTPPSLVKYT